MRRVQWAQWWAGTCAPALHHTPYDGHRMAYVVWIVWGSYGAHTVGKSPWDDRMSYGVCRMDRMAYDATLVQWAQWWAGMCAPGVYPAGVMPFIGFPDEGLPDSRDFPTRAS
jgi:hypothetical protein